MALIKCPECGREKVSDTAEACPDCGFGVRAHFERIKLEEDRKEQESREALAGKRAEIDAKMREEERIKNVLPPTKPELMVPIAIFIISAFTIAFGILGIYIGKAQYDEKFYWEGGFFICSGIVVAYLGIKSLRKNLQMYRLSKTNLREYQRQVIRKEDAERAARSARQAAAARATRKAAIKVACPYCQSYNTRRITSTAKAADAVMFGVYGQKRRYQWHCDTCNSNF